MRKKERMRKCEKNGNKGLFSAVKIKILTGKDIMSYYVFVL